MDYAKGEVGGWAKPKVTKSLNPYLTNDTERAELRGGGVVEVGVKDGEDR